MRRTIATILSITAIVTVLTACGGQQDITTGADGTVSGSAVSGSAISTSDANPEKDKVKKKPYTYPCSCTDTNWYRNNEEYTGIIQSRLDGTKQKEILKGEDKEFVTVADGYLYYLTTDRNEDTTGFWRVPIQKDGDGNDVISEKETEELVVDMDSMANRRSFYINEEFVLYQTKERKLVQLDLHTMEKQEVEKPTKKIEDLVFYESGEYILTADVDESAVFARKIKGKEWVKIADYAFLWDWIEEYDEFAWSSNGRYFFHLNPNVEEPQEIRRCKLENGEENKFVTKEQLRQAVSTALALEVRTIDVCSIQDLFCVEERLYFQVQVNWKQKDEYHMAYLMFSQGQDETEIRCETEINDCLRDQSTVLEGKWVLDNGKAVRENVVIVEGQCCDIIGDNVYLITKKAFYDEEEQLAVYNRKTKEFRRLSEKDIEYFPLLYRYDNRYLEGNSAYRLYCGDYFMYGIKDERGERLTKYDWDLSFVEEK